MSFNFSAFLGSILRYVVYHPPPCNSRVTSLGLQYLILRRVYTDSYHHGSPQGADVCPFVEWGSYIHPRASVCIKIVNLRGYEGSARTEFFKNKMRDEEYSCKSVAAVKTAQPRVVVLNSCQHCDFTAQRQHVQFSLSVSVVQSCSPP